VGRSKLRPPVTNRGFSVSEHVPIFESVLAPYPLHGIAYSRRPLNAPAVFIHELKHDGYRLQIHVCDGRVHLYAKNRADWSRRYPLIVEAARKLSSSVILDVGVVWLDSKGTSIFDALHSRANDEDAVALAFDLLVLDGDDIRKLPFTERKAPLEKSLRRTRGGIQ